jgi:hypothetical protein
MRYGYLYGISPNYRTWVRVEATLAQAREAARRHRLGGYSTGAIHREGNGGTLDAAMAKIAGTGVQGPR